MTDKVVVGAHPWVYAATRRPYEISPILDQIFSDMSYAGYDGIELMPDALGSTAGVEMVRELSDEYSLPVIGTSWGAAMWDRARHEAILAEAAELLPRLAAVGGRTLGTSVGRTPEPKTEEQLDAQAEVLRQMIALCAQHGVVLNLHNHTYEVENGLPTSTKFEEIGKAFTFVWDNPESKWAVLKDIKRPDGESAMYAAYDLYSKQPWDNSFFIGP